MDEIKTENCDMFNSRDVSKSSNEKDINLPMLSNPIVAVKKNGDDDDDPRNFTVSISKKVKIRIYKPLIALKLALFIWYGAGSAVTAFIFVFFKQKGILVTELATIYLILPMVQILGPLVSGIIVDKIGSSKPVLIVILSLSAILAVGIVAAPDMNNMRCDLQPVNLQCHQDILGQLTAETNCNASVNVTEFTSCNVTCPQNISQYCNERNLICELLKRNENEFLLFAHVSSSYKLKGKCYNITSISLRNMTYSVCSVQNNSNCIISCLYNTNDDCSTTDNRRTGRVILNVTLLILLLTMISTTYRIMDVTAMTLVEEHNSDFGRHRIFAMTGAFLFSTLSGYLVNAFSTGQEGKNYTISLYFFITKLLILFAIIFKLKIQIKPPGKNMWKKALYLLRKPDVTSFSLILLVLGSASGFSTTFLYWYLEELGASSSLLGLIHGVRALYGLPFLVTSNWWMKKFGARQMLIFGLLGYVAQGIGYSLIYNPWISLFLQAARIFNYHLLWVAVVLHSHSIAPEGLTATVITMAGGTHFNLGQGAGSLIGGHVMNAFGARVAFRVTAVTCLTSAILYAIYLCVRKRNARSV